MRFIRYGLMVTGLILATLVLLWWLAHPGNPDAFYHVEGEPIPSTGQLIRQETFHRTVPAGARAKRILYGTTRTDGSPAIASAIIMVGSAQTVHPRPVIAWAHGTTGIAPGCAPSMMATPFANLPAMGQLIENGWALVATDYVGLGTRGQHAYLVGDEAARAVLDAVRAAGRIEEFGIGTEFVAWGHSQGGNTALWVGARAPVLAPELQLRGVVAMAPASDLIALIEQARTSMFGKIVSSYLVEAHARLDPPIPVEDYVALAARPVVRDLASRCVGGWETLVSAAETMLLPVDGIFFASPVKGALGARLRGNTPTLPISVPVMIAQGERDDLVFADIQKRYVDERCAAGQAIDYRVYAGRDHISLVAGDSELGPVAMTWTAERFANHPTAMLPCPKS